jgi:hypothetical protein
MQPAVAGEDEEKTDARAVGLGCGRRWRLQACSAPDDLLC